MNPEDEALLAELAAALAEEPDAADVAAVGEAVWAWHDPDAALAALTMDSATEPLAGVRSAGGLRLLRFDADGVTIDVELIEGHLRGLAIAPHARTIDLHGPDGAPLASAEVDATGWFDLAVPTDLRGRAALVRLRLSDAADAVTWTAWFRL
ncbi:MAG TPA: hypothetical protein PKE46_11145 [Micropruina sp.]|nr:hypothetical protein [Micropruina sp.]HMR22683.1 hypothetical protein [Micropruina sp.]